jgi:hypothetical protein
VDSSRVDQPGSSDGGWTILKSAKLINMFRCVPFAVKGSSAADAMIETLRKNKTNLAVAFYHAFIFEMYFRLTAYAHLT